MKREIESPEELLSAVVSAEPRLPSHLFFHNRNPLRIPDCRFSSVLDYVIWVPCSLAGLILYFQKKWPFFTLSSFIYLQKVQSPESFHFGWLSLLDHTHPCFQSSTVLWWARFLQDPGPEGKPEDPKSNPSEVLTGVLELHLGSSLDTESMFYCWFLDLIFSNFESVTLVREAERKNKFIFNSRCHWLKFFSL